MLETRRKSETAMEDFMDGNETSRGSSGLLLLNAAGKVSYEGCQSFG